MSWREEDGKGPNWIERLIECSEERKMFLGTLCIGDRVKLVPATGKSKIENIRYISESSIITSSGKVFDRWIGFYSPSGRFREGEFTSLEPLEGICLTESK